jgi:hypothetical protein
MADTFRPQPSLDNEDGPATFPALLHLPRPLLDYSIIMAIIKGDVGATGILKDAMVASKNLSIGNLLLALGPTTPLSLQPPSESRILWVTFTDGQNLLNGPRVTIVPPTHLTDLSLNLEKLSKTTTTRIPLILGDFLDNVLSVSSSPAGLYSFLCKLFTRIRTNGQTAFLLATEDMHDSKKIAILKRFADVVIEYRAIQDEATQRLEARILDHVQGHYSVWDSSENPEYDGGQFLSSIFSRSGRRKLIQNPIELRF